MPFARFVALGPAWMPPALLGSALALAVWPALDALGMGLGVPYEHPFGPRGFSHSLPCAAFALADAVGRLVFVD